LGEIKGIWSLGWDEPLAGVDGSALDEPLAGADRSVVSVAIAVVKSVEELIDGAADQNLANISAVR